MNRGLLRLAVIGVGAFVGSHAILDTIATAALASSPRRRVLDVSAKEEKRKLRPQVLRNSAFLAVAITGVLATVITVSK